MIKIIYLIKILIRKNISIQKSQPSSVRSATGTSTNTLNNISEKSAPLINKQIIKKHLSNASISIPSVQKIQTKVPLEIPKKASAQGKEKEKEASLKPANQKTLSKVNSCKQFDQTENKLVKQSTDKNMTKNSQQSTQDKFTMSYLLEQDISRDSINFHDISETVLKDIESEMKDLHHIFKTEPSPISSKRSSKGEISYIANKKSTSQSIAQSNRISLVNTQPIQVIKKKA